MPIIAFDSAPERSLCARAGIARELGATTQPRRALPRSLRGRCGGEVKGGADAVLDKRAGQLPGDRVGGLPAGAAGGMITSGASCPSARTVSTMTGSNSGPLRWNPPMTACSVLIPVRRWALRQMLMIPACPHPVGTVSARDDAADQHLPVAFAKVSEPATSAPGGPSRPARGGWPVPRRGAAGPWCCRRPSAPPARRRARAGAPHPSTPDPPAMLRRA